MPANDAFSHNYNGASAAYDETLQQEGRRAVCEHYAYLDFDPNDNGAFGLATEGHSRVHLRIKSDSGDDARIIPIEIMKIAGAA